MLKTHKNSKGQQTPAASWPASSWVASCTSTTSSLSEAVCAIRDELTGVKWFIHWLKWSCKRSRVDIPKRHELQSIFLSFCLSVPQLVRWSWRVPAFLWRRETLWLWAAETGWTPPISPQISTKMAASSGAALQETWASTVFLNLMKDSTSATCPEADYHQTAGWLSEVRGALKALKTTSYYEQRGPTWTQNSLGCFTGGISVFVLYASVFAQSLTRR